MIEREHPARSTEFLSRLQDGELSAAERESFEAHRAECAECREAAGAFGATLAAYRASSVAPAAADLSARILRKIRAQSPSRRPFGVMFGIDVRWAGVFVAALVVLLISTPLVLRRPRAIATVAPQAFPARIVEDADAEKAKSESRTFVPPAAPPAARAAASPASAPAETAGRPEVASIAAAPPAKPAIPEAPTDEEQRRFARAPSVAQAAPDARTRPLTDAPGGEAAASAGPPEAAEAGPRLVVKAFDGQGLVPAILAHPSDARLSALKGREWILTVEAGGRVRSVQASSADGFVARPSEDSATPVDSGQAVLRELRFAPGDRPRRLLLRVE